MRKTLLLLFSCLTFSVQAQVLSGRVLDEQGLALPGATILLTDLNTGATTDVNGNFRLINIPGGEHDLKISFIGYGDHEQKIDISRDQTIFPVFKLKPVTLMGDEVIVMGDRLKGQAKALSQQYSNANITNIVASDQIGRFPDGNIGDAMKRIPGITMQYDQGEARFGIIRGLSPQLNSVMINGERIPSAEAEIRSIQLDLVPADMVQTIEVNKAITPDMDADAIGGAVNLVTRSAPSGLRVSGTTALGYGLLRQKPILNGNLVLGNRFLKNKLGVIVSGSYYDNKFGSDDVEASWNEEDGQTYIEELEIRRYDLQRTRRSVSAALDYKINANHTLNFNWIYNHRDDWENRFRLRYRDLSNPEAESGEITDVTIVRETKGGVNSDRVKNARLEDQRTRNFSLSGEHLFGKLKTNWSAAFARASEERPDERYIQWEIDEAATGMVSTSDPRLPTFTPTSDVALSQFDLGGISTQNQFQVENDKNFRLDFSLPLKNSFTKDFIKFGGRLRMKEKERNNTFFDAESTGDFGEAMADHSSKDYTLDDFQAGNYTSGAFTTPEYLGSLALYNPSAFDLETNLEEITGNFVADEIISGGYMMLNKAIGEKFLFIAGFRVEKTDVDYEGFEFDFENETRIPTSGNDSYTNFLPGLHLRYNVKDQFVLRAAYTNSIARPNYFDLVPYRLIENTNEVLSEGNSNLKPTTAVNFDLMGEKYFESIGVVSLGVFRKNLSDIIFRYQQANYTDAASGVLFEEYVQPRNGGKASLAGVEVAFQRQLDFLPGALKGLGLYTNYTYTHSKADEIEGREGEDLGLPGNADHTMNFSLSFETKTLVMRLSYNFTSDYIDELGDNAFFDRYYDKQSFLDFNGSYALSQKFRIFAEANNLTNQSLRYYQGTSSRTMQNEFYRSRFNLGIKFDLFKTAE